MQVLREQTIELLRRFILANNICWPYQDEAINDLKKGESTAIIAGKNIHTKYYTIAGDWKAIFDGGLPIPMPPFGIPVWTPVDNDCIDAVAMVNYQIEGSREIGEPNDGMVPVKSVESGEFNSLGHTDDCHTNLFGDEEFNKAMSILGQ